MITYQYAKKLANLKSGREELIYNSQPTKYNLLDFWRWNVSDLLSNTTRGRFAEFIVATAADVNLNEVRSEWGAFDLETRAGIKIEVKSAAYLQNWDQQQLSKISFSTKLAKPWDAETDKRSIVPKRSADLYVFCLLFHDNKETVEPLNLDHWEFYVLATRELNQYSRSQQSITLKSLQRLTKAVYYDQLNAEVIRKNEVNNGNQ